jgi:phage FluMu protein Com
MKTKAPDKTYKYARCFFCDANKNLIKLSGIAGFILICDRCEKLRQEIIGIKTEYEKELSKIPSA